MRLLDKKQLQFIIKKTIEKQRAIDERLTSESPAEQKWSVGQFNYLKRIYKTAMVELNGNAVVDGVATVPYMELVEWYGLAKYN